MSETTAAGGRYDVYGAIHKALRFGLCNLLIKLGQTDFADASATAEALGALRAQLSFSASHLRHEDDHLHTALDARQGGNTEGLEAAHRHHEDSFFELELLAARIEAAEPVERRALGRELYLRFTLLVAEDLAHMAEEELVTQPLLHTLFSDAELVAISNAIRAEIPPEEGMAMMRLFLPSMNPAERAGFLGAMRASAPPEMFDAILQFAARPSLPAAEWRRLSADLGLAA